MVDNTLAVFLTRALVALKSKVGGNALNRMTDLGLPVSARIR